MKQIIMKPHPMAIAWMSLCSLVLASAPAQAAEELTLRFGPFEQTVKVSEVEAYAKTGELSPSLQLFSAFLTPSVRKGLTTKLELNPKVVDTVVGNLLKSPAGKQLMDNVQTASPGLTPELVQAGVSLAASQFGKVDAIGVLKTIPTKTVTIDLSQAAALGSKINLNYWKSQALGSVLEKSLLVEGNSNFNSAIDPSVPGPIAYQRQTLILADSGRKNREIPVDLYLSETASPDTPTVVISPGFEASRNFLGYLGNHFASHGINAIVVEHPTVLNLFRLSAFDIEKLLPAQELLDRPKDLQFALGELEKLPDFKTRLNFKQLVVVGHSMGGYDALALAGGELQLDELRQFCQQRNRLITRSPADWLQCAGKSLPDRTINLRDDRVVGAIALNPVAGQIFGKSGLKQVKTPTLMLTSTEDGLTPTFDQQLQPFMQLPTPKYLITAIGATHLSVSDRLSSSSGDKTLIKERGGSETESLRAVLRGTSLSFVKQFTPERDRYQGFLSAGYVQSRSTSEMPLRLNTELPSSVTRLLNLAGMF
jgi:predicted dienelactone hydrolase